MYSFKIPFSVTLAGIFGVLVACSPAPSSAPAPAAKKSKTNSNTTQTDGSQSTGDLSEEVPCWEKILSTPAVTSCSGIYAFSSATCASGITKEASCTRDVIASKYGTATLSGKPVMETVDQWISEGYEPNQCGVGSDGKFYAYFIKKTFTPKNEATNSSSSYTVADKKLGSGGDILNSIVVKSGGSLSDFSCTDTSATPSPSPSPSSDQVL